ncbi:MAG: DUF1800 domain-containing protein [FCB group bacterium]|jgi:uncharacterized protein (DUF1800 family)|nr:DUF1800 domain-containing protein [FCB group bacterium]
MHTPLLDPIDGSQWNPDSARHLLNRAGFGMPRSRIQRLASLSPVAAVDELVEWEKAAQPYATPDFLTLPEVLRELRAEYALLDEEERRVKSQELRKREREAVTSLQAWWIQRMATTPCPLQEKMALFWHGHFATSAQKVQSSYHNFALNDLFRQQATGNFKSLAIAVGQSSAMLRYLDNAQSTKRQPNENWARELMELFTIGKGHYSEDDIKESARAFTGWGFDDNGFRFREETHDFGEKTFMGRTGDFDGWDIFDILFEQPATAEFICGKLCRFFVREEPDQGLVEGLADTFRRTQYELKPVLRQLFLSKAFYDPKAVGTQVKSPARYVVGLAADLGVERPPWKLMARATDQLGQRLFFPPNVKGWDGNRAWINANTLLIRCNLPAEFASQAARRKKPSEDSMMMMSEAAEVSGAWTPDSLLRDLRFETAGECAIALERHFLAVPLREEQRRILLQALGAQDAAAPLRPDAVPHKNLLAALHLLLSSAEYQLC